MSHYYSKIPCLEVDAHFSTQVPRNMLEFNMLKSSDQRTGNGPGVTKNTNEKNVTRLAYTSSLDLLADWAIEYLNVVHATLGADYIRENCAVAMDIDDTIITRSNPMNADSGDSYVMSQTKRVYDHGISLGFTFYFITARPDMPANQEWTRRELDSHGFSVYKELFMISSAADRNDIVGSEYKRRSREIIEKRDQKSIVLNIGDRWSDLLLYPDGDRSDGRIHAHSPYTRTDSLAYGLLHQTPPFWNYIAILPDIAWVSLKIADRYAVKS